MIIGLQAGLMLLAGFISAAAIFFLWYAQRKIVVAHRTLKESEDRWEDAKRSIDTERREASLKLKDEMYRKRKEFELELKRERLELDRLQNKLTSKYEHIESRENKLDEQRRELQQKEREMLRVEDSLRANEAKLKKLYDELISKLEQVSNMSKDEAKKALAETIEAEVNLASQKWIQKVEEDTRQKAKQKSTDIIVSAMQRYAADQVTPHSSGVVHLPSDDMKGRIIGKEGRNIKALEMATGMEFVIGDSADITVSGFNPIRREVARRTLERLIADGRINPSRIEETVELCEKEIEEAIEEYGKEAVLEFNLQSVHPEIVTLLGKLNFRTSFSQNVLQHCKEVAIFSRLVAEDLGLDGSIALRAGLLHDIGKAVSAEVEGPHAQIGAEIAKRCGEDPVIVNAIAAHHEDEAPNSVYAWIVIIADTISASRPGARRETLSTYIKRLEKLEEIAAAFEGVKKAYALQAGRELRIIVEEDTMGDDQSLDLARNVARKIEQEMSFPGQIKVNVIREKRAIEYAR